jgi:RNA polymerase sigma factor (sigma-70 family)
VTNDLIAKARAGDGEAFRDLTEPHRRELQVHCYRMLGSLQDAEDLLQDTLLAAWQGLEGFEERASIRTWLYRIATNRCLNAIRSTTRRAAKEWDIPEVEPPEPSRIGEVVWLEPYPDALLEATITGPTGAPGPLNPESRYQQNEAISLAFITALQLLPARQRAVLILREVIGYHASEVAAMLDSTVESVNSALKRARAGIRRRSPSHLPDRLPRRSPRHSPHRLPASGDLETPRPLHLSPPSAPATHAEREVVAKFVSAWESGDVDALVALLTSDVTVSMPPIPLEYHGLDDVARFFATFMRSRSHKLVPTRANGQPAFGAYLRAPEPTPADGLGLDHAKGTGLFVLTIAGDRISALTRFESTVLPWFGLPPVLPLP